MTKTWRRSPWTQTARGLVGGGGQPAQGGEEGVTGHVGFALRPEGKPGAVLHPAGAEAHRPPQPALPAQHGVPDGFIITRSWMSRQSSPVSFPSSTVTQVPTTNSWWVFPSMEKEWVNPASPRRTRRPW